MNTGFCMVKPPLIPEFPMKWIHFASLTQAMHSANQHLQMCEQFFKATVSKSQRCWPLITSNLYSMNLILPWRFVLAFTGWGCCNIWERQWAAVGQDDGNSGPGTIGNIKMVYNLVWQLRYSIRYDVADSRYCGWGHCRYCGQAWFLPGWIGERSTVGSSWKGPESCPSTGTGSVLVCLANWKIGTIFRRK